VPTKLDHGSYYSTSPFDVVQHQYAAGEWGYVELLEVKDTPEGHLSFVLLLNNTSEGLYFFDEGYHLWERATRAEADQLWELFFSNPKKMREATTRETWLLDIPPREDLAAGG